VAVDAAIASVAVDAAPAVLDRLRAGQRGQIHWRSVMQDVDEEGWRRRLRLRSFRRPEDWQGHVDETRRRFLAAIGPLPEVAPGSAPAVRRVGVLVRRGYVV
jgi:hypothetical protein